MRAVSGGHVLAHREKSVVDIATHMAKGLDMRRASAHETSVDNGEQLAIGQVGPDGGLLAQR